MHRLACLRRVSAQAVLPWSRAVAQPSQEKPEPSGRTIVLELDAMGHSRKTTRHTLWLGKALEHDPGQRLDGAWGRRDKATLKQMVARLAKGDVQRYGTDTWATSASVIPPDKLGQSQATTHDSERNHCRHRHGFGRVKRKSILVSKSKEMGDLTRALFATFGVNGNQDELLSLLD
jgi:IS1 family transposase